MKNNLTTLILSTLLLAGICFYNPLIASEESKPPKLISSNFESLSQEEMTTFLKFLSQNEAANRFVEGFGIEPVSYSSEGRVSGIVYNDLNENGEREEGESGILGVEITLKKLEFYWFWPYFKIVAHTTTDEYGFYQFEQLTWGIYLLLEKDLPECTGTTKNFNFAFINPAYEEWEINFGNYCEGGTTECTDSDGDGFTIEGGDCGELDCDDANPDINPDATEICDGLDNNCDEQIDEELGTTTCGVGECERMVDNCVDGVLQECIPGEPASEICDGLDNNCDEQIDEELGTTTCGIGECEQTVDNCVDGVPRECIPGEPASEICDGLDNNCDEQIDEELGTTTCGIGECERTVDNCVDGILQECIPGEPASEICDGLDNNCDEQIDEDLGTTTCGIGECERTVDNCVDGVPRECVPGEPAPEVCDGLDNNCDEQIDEGVLNTYYRDADVDGYGDPADSVQACNVPVGYVENSNDCDDTSGEIHPAAVEDCTDGVDNDCNELSDSDDPACQPVCTDADGDGFSEEGGECGPVDCNDEDNTIYPGASETCEDGTDQNCDGKDLLCILEDNDGDLWAASQGDCDDTDPTIFPGATDFPNDGIDQDCDGVDDPVPSEEDFDHDGVTFAEGDCNDRMPSVHPGATEILCNGIDDDCDGTDTCGISPTEEPESGFITGEVFDADSRLPLPGATIMVHGEGELLTDAEGKCAFPVPETKVYRLTVEKTGYSYGQRIIRIEKGFAFAIDPIYLKPLDSATTEIGPGGGTHTSSAGDVVVEFPPGAVTGDITVSATRFLYGDSLPSPLPETSHFTTAVELLPDGITFETPVKILVENSYNIAPGTPVPVGFYRKDLGIWIPDGMGIITPDGQHMEYWTKHFSPEDLNFPAYASPGSGQPDGRDEIARDPCKVGDSGHSKVTFKDGELMEDYYLPSFKSLGKTISPRLVYRSFAADPKSLFTTRYDLDTSEIVVPETTEFTIKVAGTKKTVHFTGIDGPLKHSYLFDGIDYKGTRLTTGIYPYAIELANCYPAYYYLSVYFGGPPAGSPLTNDAGRPIRAASNIRFSQSFYGTFIFENLQDSSFGAGWSLAGIPRIHIGKGRVLMAEGSGNLKAFTSPDTITTVAGDGTWDFYGDEGEATDAALNRPLDVALDKRENFYIADSVNRRIRKVDINGIITSVAGANSPDSTAVDALGNVYYIGKSYNGSEWIWSVRKKDANGSYAIVAGGGNTLPQNCGSGCLATEVSLILLRDITLDPLGNIYLSSNNMILKVDTDGILTTVVGSGLSEPWGIALDAYGNLYIADYGNWRVLKMDADEIITTVAGGGNPPDGIGDKGPATDARLRPRGVAVDYVGNLYISDILNQRIRKVNTDGIITTVAGGGDPPDGLGDEGPATGARLRDPYGIDIDAVGNIYIAEYYNSRIRKVFSGDPTADQIVYESPRGDYSTLIRNSDFTFTQTLKDGTVNKFDKEGYLNSTTDTNGNSTSYTYVDGNLTTITYPTGQVTLVYSSGKLTSITDPAGRETIFQHDEDGNLIEITDPEGHPVSFDYIGNHLLHTKTDKNGNATRYNYDANGLIELVVSELEGDEVITDFQPSDARGLINDLPPGVGTSDNPADAVFKQDSTYTDPNGNTYTIETDIYGREIKRIDPLGNVTEYERGCACGAATKIVKPNGAVSTMEYDDRGNLISRTEQIDELKSATYTYEYNYAFNKVTRITDPENNETDFEYDANGNLIKTSDALDNETVFSYDSRGLLLTVTDALDHTSTNTYDALGNLETSSDALGTTTTYEYHLAGNVTKVTDAEGNYTTYAYDSMNRLLSVTDDLNNTTAYTYDGNGNMRTVTDAENTTTAYEYDAKGRSTLITDAENNHTNLAYDTNGNLVSVTDANEKTTTYVYDAINRLTRKIYHDGEKYIYTYDEVGNTITETDPNGSTTTFDYDLANRLLTKTYPDTSTGSYTYDIMGRMLTGTNTDSTLTYTYDALGRVENATFNGKTLSYGYDGVGNRSSMTTPESEIIEYNYNSGNQMTRTEMLSTGKGIDYSYDALNRVKRKDYTGGSYSTYVFDDAGRLESINHKRSDESEIYTQNNTPDKVGNIISKTTGLGTTSYDYDNIYQLNTAAHPTHPQEDFTYGPVGNRLTSTDHSDWTYNDRNQLVGYNGSAFIYDLNGNTISKIDTSGTTSYTYNYDNRLTRVDFPGGGYATYKYDVRGRRVEKNVDGVITKYLYDGNSLLAEYDASDTLQRNYFYGAGEINPSILYEGSSVYFYYHDHLNTPQKVTDESGAIVWEATYKSFGETNITTETVSNNFRFPGQYFDQETGLHYNYHRYYDPKTGRYLREDPMGIQEGMNHLYVYVQNNPLRYIDPQGLKGCGPGSGVKEWLIPDYPAGYDFSGCCDKHDDCYGCEGKAQGKSKRDCDLQFCKCLIMQCLISARLDRGLACPSFTYCVGVILFGGGAFTNARECCP